jgi:signal transduction histidine kinase
MSMKWKLTDRTKMLLKLELAITLPAVALMAFGIWNLKSIQRDQAIEAVIQRQLHHVLMIAEDKSWDKVSDLVEPARKKLPNINAGDQKIKEGLDLILRENPQFAYAMMYDKNCHVFVSAIQPNREHDEDFWERSQEAINSANGWLPLQANSIADHVRMGAEKGMPFEFYGEWASHHRRHTYMNEVFLIPPGAGKEEAALAILSFDQDYLQSNLIPAVIKDVLNSKGPAIKKAANSPAIMVRPMHSMEPWVASANWDGGKPEVEEGSDEVLQGLVWSAKYPGTTIAEMGAKFLKYNFTILGALCLLMIGGIFLTYRNISREMNLARLKSDFVANVSHELRTPLALIRLYAETLELGRLTSKEKYQEYFRIIREESERLSSLINNILDFSRIEAGRKEYEFKETDLSELVRSTLDTYRFQIEQNGFTFEENIAKDLPAVNVDREAIARSLLNLVNNALKYSRDKKYIGVSLYRANGSVKLEVSDHGIGIPVAEQDKIFEKFYRCGDPLVHNVKGSGLGLALVRHIARAHGGDVKVESAPEKGSKFTIALPLDHMRPGVAPANTKHGMPQHQ